MHPKTNSENRLWRECSVGGDIFNLRESRSAQQKGQPVMSHSNHLHFVSTPFRIHSINTFFVFALQVYDETNILQDGTHRFMRCNTIMEVIGGTAKFTRKTIISFYASIIWLEVSGWTHFQHILFAIFDFLQTKRDLEKLVDELNDGRPQCPVGLNTLVIPRKVSLNDQVNQPYVYLKCGHVQGLCSLRVAYLHFLSM